jgi:hypothetical protein
LKDPQSKNKQYEIPLRSFIERWVKKNISKEFNKFGFKFELSEYSPCKYLAGDVEKMAFDNNFSN